MTARNMILATNILNDNGENYENAILEIIKLLNKENEVVNIVYITDYNKWATTRY